MQKRLRHIKRRDFALQQIAGQIVGLA